MDEARSAMMKSQYSEAMKQCDEALKIKPGDNAAATMCGIAACNLKDGALAKKYAEQVSISRRVMIRQQCLKAGVPGFEAESES